MTDWNKVNENWKTIVDTYERLFKIPNYIIEYVAVYDYVLLSASGKSNKAISDTYAVQDIYVEQTCLEFLRFPGWKYDLDVNPLFIYKNTLDRDNFISILNKESKIMSMVEKDQAYLVCENFVEMERKINEYYY